MRRGTGIVQRVGCKLKQNYNERQLHRPSDPQCLILLYWCEKNFKVQE